MSIVQLSDKISKFMMVLAAAWAFVLTFIIIADITSRGLFNDPLNGTREIVANSIVMIVFLQAGYAIRSRSMLSADFLIDLFPPPARRVVLALRLSAGRRLSSCSSSSAAGTWPSIPGPAASSKARARCTSRPGRPAS